MHLAWHTSPPKSQPLRAPSRPTFQVPDYPRSNKKLGLWSCPQVPQIVCYSNYFHHCRTFEIFSTVLQFIGQSYKEMAAESIPSYSYGTVLVVGGCGFL